MKVLRLLDENILVFNSRLKNKVLILVSGEPKFCDEYHTDPAYIRVDISNKHLRNRKVLKSKGWKTLSHQMVGGCTSFLSIFKF